MRLSSVLTILILMVIHHSSFAEKAGKSEIHRYAEDKNWSCAPTGKVKVKEAASRKKEDEVSPVCIYDVKCEKISGTAARDEILLVTCKPSGNVCLDFDDCLKALPEYEKDELTWEAVSVSTKKAEATHITDYGTNCEYKDEKPKVLFRQHLKKNTMWDAMCATPVKNCKMPEALKGSFLATCGITPKKFRKTDDEISCPAVQDCLADAIEAKPALTKSEAALLIPDSSRPVISSTAIANSTGGSSSSSGAPGKKDPGKDSDDHR